MGVKSTNPSTTENPCIILDFPKNSTIPVVPQYHRGVVPGFHPPPQVLKFMNAQVLYIKGCRSMHIVSLLHWQTPNHGSKQYRHLMKKLYICREVDMHSSHASCSRVNCIFKTFEKNPFIQNLKYQYALIQFKATRRLGLISVL